MRIVAWKGNALPVHASIPAAIFQPWPDTPDEVAKLVASVDAIAIGPGLGATPETRDLVPPDADLLVGPGGSVYVVTHDEIVHLSFEGNPSP